MAAHAGSLQTGAQVLDSALELQTGRGATACAVLGVIRNVTFHLSVVYTLSSPRMLGSLTMHASGRKARNTNGLIAPLPRRPHTGGNQRITWQQAGRAVSPTVRNECCEGSPSVTRRTRKPTRWRHHCPRHVEESESIVCLAKPAAVKKEENY